jgi:hypothetical protein
MVWSGGVYLWYHFQLHDRDFSNHAKWGLYRTREEERAAEYHALNKRNDDSDFDLDTADEYGMTKAVYNLRDEPV